MLVNLVQFALMENEWIVTLEPTATALVRFYVYEKDVDDSIVAV